jgi:hypothetical protein
MQKLSRKAAFSLVAATIAVAAFVSPASAQANAEQIRAQCIDEVGKAHPGSSNDLQTMRTNLYIACMRRNGLQP